MTDHAVGGTFVRTVLGDIDPTDLGITYAHEHLVIDGGRPVLLEPDFDLSDVDAMVAEVGAAVELGLGAVVDAMPCDAGRNATKLGAISRRTGVHVVAPTGLHHERYAASGATAEYDGSFRWGDAENGTLLLLDWMAEDGFLGQVVLGMDAARRGYLSVYGGGPGLTWLLDGFSAAMDERGLGPDCRRQLFVVNPARVFAFAIGGRMEA